MENHGQRQLQLLGKPKPEPTSAGVADLGEVQKGGVYTGQRVDIGRRNKRPDHR
jgi:hypothetical protein